MVNQAIIEDKRTDENTEKFSILRYKDQNSKKQKWKRKPKIKDIFTYGKFF